MLKCEYCGDDILRKEGISDAKYFVRVYCSKKCCKAGSRKKTQSHIVRDDAREHTKRYGCVKNGKNHPIYNAWLNMKHRCYYKGSPYYKNYGGRGISVCDEWRGAYVGFMEWSLSSGWAHRLTLDRIDNAGNYSPENCRWATHKQQHANTRANRVIVFQGTSKNVTEWAQYVGLSRSGFISRLQAHDIAYAITTPINRRYVHTKVTR